MSIIIYIIVNSVVLVQNVQCPQFYFEAKLWRLMMDIVARVKLIYVNMAIEEFPRWVSTDIILIMTLVIPLYDLFNTIFLYSDSEPALPSIFKLFPFLN